MTKLDQGPLSIRLDVADALPQEVTGGKSLHIAAWVFLPNPATLSDCPSVITLLNGGTYDKRYFHFEVPGQTSYSMAEFLRARGHIVILPDHIGISDSDRAVDQMKVTRHVAAAANHAAIEQIYARLRAGTVSPNFPALPRFIKVGGGHSMGGFQTITQQAAHQSYDLCLILGYTANGVHLTVNGELVRAHQEIDFSQPDYVWRDRAVLRSTFHWPDVSEAVIAVDNSLVVEVPYMMGTQATQEGIVRDDAAKISVPIYICLGERDVSPNPHAEPGYYNSSRDITLHILPRSGHCHNFATTRLEMFDRIDRWVRDQAKNLGMG